jgi:glycogen operon protein
MAKLRLGTPYPLGATWDGPGVNFAIFSQHAEKVELVTPAILQRGGE